MSKRKKGPRGQGRGVIAIALFDIAGAMERWAAAQERIAASNERLRDQAAESLDLQRRDTEERLAELPSVLETVRELDRVIAEFRAYTGIESVLPKGKRDADA